MFRGAPKGNVCGTSVIYFPALDLVINNVLIYLLPFCRLFSVSLCLAQKQALLDRTPHVEGLASNTCFGRLVPVFDGRYIGVKDAIQYISATKKYSDLNDCSYVSDTFFTRAVFTYDVFCYSHVLIHLC